MLSPLPIPPSASDELLRSWGYDLISEYEEMMRHAAFEQAYPVIDLATGSGRMTAVLVHLGYQVVTGDRTQEQMSRVQERLTPRHRTNARFLMLDMDRLPFHGGSIRNLVCVNTLHELDDPSTAIDEILRVMHPKGRILFADFSDLGFDVMQQLEREVYRRDHRRGDMPMADVMTLLQSKGCTVQRIELPLNVAVVVRQSPVR